MGYITRVSVDQKTCIGDGSCLEACPEIFQILPGERVASVNPEAVHYFETREDEIRCAAECCPSNSITIEESSSSTCRSSWMDQLQEILPPPNEAVNPPTNEDWAMVEKTFGMPLPSELFSFSRTYGTGTIRGKKNTAVSIYNPGQPEFIQILQFECQRLRDIRGTHKTLDKPFDVFPERGGLLPLGSDECDVWICWEVSGIPEKWPIIVRWSWGIFGMRRFELSLTEFLVRILKRQIELPGWPRPTFFDQIEFVPYRGNSA